MSGNWIGLAAIILILISAFIGYKKGFIKEAISTCFVILSLALVWFLNPYVNQFLHENTSLSEKIEEGCENLLTDKLQELGASVEDTGNALVESLNLPGFLKNQINSYSDMEGRSTINSQDYVRPIALSLAEMLVKGISFILTYLLSVILLKIVISLLDMLAHFPIIKGINHTAGAVLGGIKGLLLVWVILMVLTLICNTEAGQNYIGLIQDDRIVDTLNSFNPFMKIFMNIKI